MTMSEPQGSEEQIPAVRGEAAWKQEQQRIADRNAQVSKAGKASREEFEQTREAHRRKIERVEMERFLRTQGSGTR
jgi:hypothetical protein